MILITIRSISSRLIEELIPKLKFEFIPGKISVVATCLAPLSEPRPGALLFCSNPDSPSLPSALLSDVALVILPISSKSSFMTTENIKPSLLFVENPRNVFAELSIVLGLCTRNGEPVLTYEQTKSTIHESVRTIGNVWIGAGVTIGKGTILNHGVYIGDNTQIGENVVIGPSASIGKSGYGFAYDVAGERINFPHIGRVILSSEVEIGANSCVDRGALIDTVIGFATKIDNLVHIAHNCQIGENVTITAGVILCGGVTIKDSAWIAPQACILNNLTIGREAFVGLGAVVIRNVLPNTRVAGNPARIIP